MENKDIQNKVGIKKIDDVLNKSEIQNGVFNLLNMMKERDLIAIPKNATVFIKANICLVKSFDTGATVDPFVAKCVVDWLLENFEIHKIIIGEADATMLNIDIAFKVLGWEEYFEEYPNVKLLNLAKDDLTEIVLDGLYFKNLKMSRIYLESDYLISLGKLKTHTMTGITCILKNQFGANPVKYKLQYHENLDEVIHDLNKVRKPDLCLVDGVIAMEGEGPILGVPKPVGLIIAGNDAVATDHACAKIMDIKIGEIKHVKLAMKQGLGSTTYSTFGNGIDQVKTKFQTISTSKKFITNLYMSKTISRIPLWKNLVTRIF